MSGGTLNRGEVERLYEVHGRALLAYACAFLRDPSEAEDVLHQVFLQLLRERVTAPRHPAICFAPCAIVR